MSAPRIDTSHIRSPRDPMTKEERDAVRAELREASEALWDHAAEHGDVRQELHELFGDPCDRTADKTDAA